MLIRFDSSSQVVISIMVVDLEDHPISTTLGKL
jgi:hypothetical protein